MSDLDYENTIAYLDGRIEELEAERKIDKDVLLKQDQTIQLRNATIQALREAVQALLDDLPMMWCADHELFIKVTALLKEGGDVLHDMRVGDSDE